MKKGAAHRNLCRKDVTPAEIVGAEHRNIKNEIGVLGMDISVLRTFGDSC